MKNIFKKIYSILAIIVILAALVFRVDTGSYVVKANEATTYTKTYNADNYLINSQNGYYPGVTYDRIGLEKPVDMALLEEEIIVDRDENGTPITEIHDMAYILNATANPAKAFILRVDLTDGAKVLDKYSLEHIKAPDGNVFFKSPSGITIQNVVDDEHLTGQLKVYICDGLASWTDPTDNTYKYTGGIVRFNLEDLKNNKKDSNSYEIIHEPTEKYNGKTRKVPSFGADTQFSPVNIAVDTAGTMYVASKSTFAGMIQLSAAGEFIGFFVVNTVTQSALYNIIKAIGNDEQLELLEIKNPPAFTNVFIDKDDLVYSVTNGSTTPVKKHATDGKVLFSPTMMTNGAGTPISDMYVTDEGLIFLSDENGYIYLFDETGQFIYFFGTVAKGESTELEHYVAGFFMNLKAIVVDSQKRIWAIDSDLNFLQSLIPTSYSREIFNAIDLFDKHDYEGSRKAWEEVLTYDSLSVLANNGIGEAYYYDGNFEEAAKYFSISKNRTLYSDSYWEIRNDWTSNNLSTVIIIVVGVIVLLVAIRYLFRKVATLNNFKEKLREFFSRKFFKDLFVGFRLIKKPGDTFYEVKTGVRGSFLGATIYYILGLIAVVTYTYGKSLPFQYVNFNTLNVAIVLIAYLVVFAIFVISNYLVSSISGGEGTFMNIYKFTGYSLLPLIICFPIAAGISYALTLTEQVIIDGLYLIAVVGSIYLLVFGVLETHNFTFGKTVKNVLLTIVGMVLIIIVAIVVFVMFDQLSQLIEGIWKEVKLRVGWY